MTVQAFIAVLYAPSVTGEMVYDRKEQLLIHFDHHGV